MGPSDATDPRMEHVAPPGTLAESYLPDLTNLSADRRATFRIGLMARLAVVAERTVRGVQGWLQVGKDPAGIKDGPQHFAELMRETIWGRGPAD